MFQPQLQCVDLYYPAQAMSIQVQTTHLQLMDLNADDKAILATLPEWLSNARFERQGEEWEKCTDK